MPKDKIPMPPPRWRLFDLVSQESLRNALRPGIARTSRSTPAAPWYPVLLSVLKRIATDDSWLIWTHPPDVDKWCHVRLLSCSLWGNRNFLLQLIRSAKKRYMRQESCKHCWFQIWSFSTKKEIYLPEISSRLNHFTSCKLHAACSR